MARWSPDQAFDWHSAQPWILGCNFIPSTAGNQLEMWQAETFDPATIEKELRLAAGLGMNAVRVYLHDLAYKTDGQKFLDRVDRFLSIARALDIRTALVLFDDCWLPDPKAGPQPHPAPGVHNSIWVQSPGVRAAGSLLERPRLKQYVQEVIGAFRRDPRVLFWDLYNELGNIFLPALARPWYWKWPELLWKFPRFEFFLPATMELCVQAFGWARDAGPDQPLTTSVYFPNPRLNRRLLNLSDVITFHNYESPGSLERQIRALRSEGRPIICTEWMARTSGSLVETNLPVFHRERIGCFNWGLVNGRTQTIYSWDKPGEADRTGIWFHDLFHADGRPYRESEAELFRKLSALAGR